MPSQDGLSESEKPLSVSYDHQYVDAALLLTSAQTCLIAAMERMPTGDNDWIEVSGDQAVKTLRKLNDEATRLLGAAVLRQREERDLGGSAPADPESTSSSGHPASRA